MKLLLDTHIFLWYISEDKRLPDETREIIRNSQNEVLLSVVSIWETIIKHKLGKLPLPQPPATYLPEQRERHRIDSLKLNEASVMQLASLPRIHRDPFDRMLICQAIEHDLTLVSEDDAVQRYPVKLFKKT